MPNKNWNRNHKKELECVPRLQFNVLWVKQQWLVQKIKHTTCILSVRIKQAFRQIRIISNMDIIYNNIHIYRILKLKDRERTWVASLALQWETRLAQQQVQNNLIYITERIKVDQISNNHLTWIIIKVISWMLGPHQGPIYFFMN